MAELYPTIGQCAILAAAFKALIFPAYRSTDFEVHRNWLAITHSLPLDKWYFESTSEWTLDYPPFFAYFEWLLSQLARYIDPGMLRIDNLDYHSWQTIRFQRATVVLSELVLAYALHKFVKDTPKPNKPLSYAAALSILLSPGLLIIDHVHFQYNGFLYGILILSISYARNQSTLLLSGILFAILLCLKHIFLYLAPAYFVYLLSAYCLGPKSIFQIRFANCVRLGASLLLVFGTAFGPFLYLEQIPQLLSRLFPFSRGLCHAYWAPNVWALYSFADRVLIRLAPRLHLPINDSAVNSATRGLVGESAFAVLPDITPRTTTILTLLFQLPPLVALFRHPTPSTFLPALHLTALTSFLLTYHVHEKAIVTPLLIASLLSIQSRIYLPAFRPLALAAHASLFPLLFHAQELPIKLVYTIFWTVATFAAFDRLAPRTEDGGRWFFWERYGGIGYAVFLGAVVGMNETWGLLRWVCGLGEAWEFLGLMGVSVGCAVGVVGSWVGFNVVFWRERR